MIKILKFFFLAFLLLPSGRLVADEATCYMSPDGLYCVYFDNASGEYMMHDMRLDFTYSLTENVEDGFIAFRKPLWRADSRYVYISGAYDIWQFDITRGYSPKKITKRHGKPLKYEIVTVDGLVPAIFPIQLTYYNTFTGEKGQAEFHMRKNKLITKKVK